MNSPDTQVKRFCLSCRHSLQGIESRRCPECGREFDPTDVSTFSRSERGRIRWIGRLALILAMYPLLLLALLYLTWLTAAASLGHWPRPYVDDARQINAVVTVLGNASLVGLVFAFYFLYGNVIAIIADAVARLVCERRLAASFFPLMIGLPMLTWCIAIVMLISDPAKIVPWLIGPK